MKSGPIYFISDLHLSCDRPLDVKLFLQFVADIASDSSGLYILGDLFDYWVGDDATFEVAIDVMEALSKLSSQHVPVYILRGNRDFLLNDLFKKKTGIIFLEDYHVLKAYGKKILLTHGDLLCTDDVKYQKFRQLSRHPVVVKLFLMLPRLWREAIAQRIRAKSGAYIVDVNLSFVEQVMRDYGVDEMIHGHTHRLACHQNPPLTRWVLGDWHGQGNCLKLTENQLTFETIELKD